MLDTISQGSHTAHALLARGALWNTFVGVAWAPTLWGMVEHVVPDLAAAFMQIRDAVGKPQATAVTERVYETLRAVNFSAGICEPLA